MFSNWHLSIKFSMEIMFVLQDIQCINIHLMDASHYSQYTSWASTCCCCYCHHKIIFNTIVNFNWTNVHIFRESLMCKRMWFLCILGGSGIIFYIPIICTKLFLYYLKKKNIHSAFVSLTKNIPFSFKFQVNI